MPPAEHLRGPVVTARECAHLKSVDPPSSLIVKTPFPHEDFSLAHCFKGQVASCGQETLAVVCFQPRKAHVVLSDPFDPFLAREAYRPSDNT